MISPSILSELAPTGKIRAGVNYGNPVLAARDPASGELRGVAVDLARELGRRIDAPVELVAYDAAGKMFDAVKAGAWDVAFLAVDPERAAEVAFSAPYLEIEGTYLAPPGSPFKTIAEIDREGARVGVGANSAYDLFLSRNLAKAKIMRAPTPSAAFDLLVEGKVDVLAGVKQALLTSAGKLPGSRVLDGRFMAIGQAVGVPRGRKAAAAYVREFVEEAKASGFVARAIEKAGIRGVAVAPPDP